MNWLAFIQLAIKAVAGVANYLGDRQLIDSGKAEAINDGLRATLANLEKADAVKTELSNNPNGDFAKRLRTKYERPDE